MRAPLGNAGPAKLLSAAATGLVGFIQSRRLCLDSVLGSVGVDSRHLGDPLAKLDLRKYCDLLDLAARRSGDDNFGLSFGQQFQPVQLGLIGYIAISSDNALHAAENLAQYFRYHQQLTSTNLSFSDPFYKLTYRIEDPRILNRHQDAVLTLGMFCNVFRHCSGADWCPDELHLEHARTGNWRDIESAFGAPVRFECRTNALLFRPERVVSRMPQADSNLLSLLCRNIMTLGLEVQRTSAAIRTEGYIRQNIAAGNLSLEHASRSLSISSRTLQRKLVEENITFGLLVENFRKSESRNKLLSSEMGVSDIAYDLGYSETSAFVRAFTRWYGISPSKFRKMHRI
ncbi:AraC-like transcriptional regulator QhpR [Methylobacterium nodulans]|uniref:Transcriptional regulator, AraC family n=1 Tax=Methylobacterium nodulans (strain LMG 21967 / CNCM I-2342 / ORS 2060) TaxID=460265 RepID=B8IW11_METNO|nr:AraC family transcriptional regulator [Methylobacterium nodulans]ACL62601.1 transcriptional regulator, AraC family [Methylobacterium nodulans ORS 2060]